MNRIWQVQGDISPLNRLTLGSLIVADVRCPPPKACNYNPKPLLKPQVHSRDVVVSLISEGVRSVAGKRWHLPLYWHLPLHWHFRWWLPALGDAPHARADFAWQSQMRYDFDAAASSSSSSSSSSDGSGGDASSPALLSVLQMTTKLSYGFEYLVTSPVPFSRI